MGVDSSGSAFVPWEPSSAGGVGEVGGSGADPVSSFTPSTLHFRILSLYDVSIQTVRFSMRVSHSVLAWLIVVLLGGRKRRKYWWCCSSSCPCSCISYISLRRFMAWVNWNDHVFRKKGEKSEFQDFENAFCNGPWSILPVACSSLRGIGSCLASDSSLKSVSILTLGADATLIGVSGESTEGESGFFI